MNSRARTTRRAFVGGIGASAVMPFAAVAQQPTAATGTPPSVISNPPRQWGWRAPPNIYPDPDVIVIDPSFAALRVGNVPIRRIATGFTWAEGPAWCSEGQYFVFSDVVGNTQYRVLWDDLRVTPFRKPSNNSNGNSFDFQGRQISAEDFFRRVIRWELDGTMTVIADKFDGKALNSPNDLVPHPDGSIWFTDPPYGDQLSEGHPDEPGGPANTQGAFNPRIGAPNAGALGGSKRELPNAVYRWDPSGRLDQVITEDQLKDPNGICFSPDYKTLYVISTGKGPGRQSRGRHTQHSRVRHAGDQAHQRARVPRHDGRRRALRPRWHARRCARQPVVQFEHRARLCRRAGLQRTRQADRTHPSARGVCQPLLRWA
jgi:gluconolactonase